MSSSRGGGRSSNNNGVAAQSIPSASRKMVQSLKEIVNCPEHEIYSTLKDCNMDPNEAVNRLLSQDPFREVKSKREKKKENKDSSERPRGVSSASNRGGRGTTDRHVGRSSSNQFGASEYGKPVYKKENGANAFMGSSSSVAGIVHQRPPVSSDSFTSDTKGCTTDILDGISSSTSQSSSGYQPAWLGVPGQLSMADIVKMGKPRSKASTPNASQPMVHNHHVQAPPFTALQNDFPSFEIHASKVSAMSSEPGVCKDQTILPSDEWSSIEHPPASSAPAVVDHPTDFDAVVDHPTDFELHVDPSNLHYDRINQQPESGEDDGSEEDEGSVENLSENHVGPASVSSRKMQEGNFGGVSQVDNDLHENMGSYQSHRHAFDHREVEEVGGPVSSVTANLHRVSIQEEDSGASTDENCPSVVIPNHLQVQTADCSHLSFGSFGSGTGASFSVPCASKSSERNLEKESAEVGVSSIEHSDTRNAEYYGEEPLVTSSDGNLVHIAGANAGIYDSPSTSEPEALKQEKPEVEHANHYSFPSTSGYTFENAQKADAGLTYAHTNPQMQNLTPFSSAMAYTHSLPSALLAATVQPARESELPYSPFPTTQSMPTKYSHVASSISGSSVSMPEALKVANFLSNQPSAQTLAGSNIATGPALPQHLAVHPYSQTALPLGPFANMIGYPFLPQSYAYMPSAFQQALAGNGTYHQSLAAVLPQYKNSTVSSLPQSANVASGYGALGSSTNIPGNFPMNPPAAAAAGATRGYDDILNSQYKDNLVSLQQNENSGMWVNGLGSRTMSAVPTNTYYSFPGQNQQPPGGFRQGPQSSQSYSSLGNPNFYHSQTGMSLEHQQQNSRDGSLGGVSQVHQPSKQSPQIWQSSY